MKRLKKLGIATLAALALGVGTDAHKHVIHNIMSNNKGGNTLDRFIRDLPKNMFTEGDYAGFMPDKEQLHRLFSGEPLERKYDMDLNAISLGLEDNPFEESPYKPTSLTYNPDIKFYSPGEDLRVNVSKEAFEGLNSSSLGRILDMEDGGAIPLDHTRFNLDYSIDFHNFTFSMGKDKKGHYLSFYDIWDFAGNGGYFKNSVNVLDKAVSLVLPTICEPIHFYERFYLADQGVSEDDLREIYERRIFD